MTKKDRLDHDKDSTTAKGPALSPKQMAKKARIDKQIDEIIERISSGEPLRQICRDPHMPKWRTVYEWLKTAENAVDVSTDENNFFARFALARCLGEDAIAQECLEIADDASNDYMDTRYGPRVDKEHIQRSKLRIETRLKLLAKWNPKRYGERVDLSSTDGSMSPVPQNLIVEFVGSDEKDTDC